MGFAIVGAGWERDGAGLEPARTSGAEPAPTGTRTE